MRSLILASVVFVACGDAQLSADDPHALGISSDGGVAGGAGGSGGAAGVGGGAAGGSAGSAGGSGGGAASCSAGSCPTGCCAGNVCQTGTTTAHCGKAGAACATCTAADSCKADQTCGLDPSSLWQVLPISAVVAPDNHGTPWDALSDPDTEISLWCPSSEVNVSAVMPMVSDSFMPTWTSGGCTVSAASLLADGLGFDAQEIDAFSNDMMTPFTVAPITEADLRAGLKSIGPAGGLDSMTVQFTRQ